jgi:glycosyltransferase involved in cell wall biosynthesis
MMIAPTSFFSDYGGHIRILEEARALQALGHKVAIVTYYKGSDMPGLDIRRTTPLPWHADYEVGSSRHKLAFDVYLAAKSLLEGLRFRPDIVHGHMHEGALIGGIVSRIVRAPLVFDFQGSLTAEMVDHAFLDPNGRFFRWMCRLERFISQKLPDAILTSSVQATRLLQQEFDVRPDKIHPLPDCADASRFDPGAFTSDAKLQLRERLGIPADDQVVVYLGLLTDYQGTHHLIEAAARLRTAGEKVHFLVMGYPSVAYYQALAQQEGVAGNMTFTGKIRYSDAPYYLALGDVAVAPKLSATEGSGKLLNYMAMAQPVVVYDTPVNREYLAELGVYVPSGDVMLFADAIADLLHAPQRRTELGQQLRRRAMEQFSWKLAGQRMSDLYHDLI